MLIRIQSSRARGAVRAGATTLIAAGLVLAGSVTASAQSPARPGPGDARWTAWLGCWQRTTGAAEPLTCVVPTARPSAVDVVTIANGATVFRERIDASGQSYPVDKEGCRGSETAVFAPNARRVYLHADLTCLGDL